jgi:hypothetical protein
MGVKFIIRKIIIASLSQFFCGISFEKRIGFFANLEKSTLDKLLIFAGKEFRNFSICCH